MNKKLVSKALTGIMISGSIFAETMIGTGAVTYNNALEPVPESVLIEHLDIDTRPRAGALPSAVDLSASKYFPTIKDQGSYQGSCSIFATTYYQFSYEANKLNDINSKDINNCYSPKWIYNSLNEGSLKGVQINDAYDFLEDYGSLRWGDFPYVMGNDKDSAMKAATDLPGETYANKMREALNCRLSKWNTYRIQGTGTAITSNKDANLDVVKSLLVHGHPLVVQVDGAWDIQESSSKEKTIVSCAANGGGHAMTVVGYNDNVWVDANGNGRKDVGESGAFKVANSWGSYNENTNAGFIWILYDALNGESFISGYEREDGKKRIPMFSWGNSTNNYFAAIEVENKEVEFVAAVHFSADIFNQLRLSYGKSEKNANPALYYGFGNYSLNRPAAYNGVVMIDLGKAMDSIVTDYRGHKWHIRIGDSMNDKQYVRNISCEITDNLGKTIADIGSILGLDGTTRTLSASIDLMVGDVDYSEIIDTDDALLVQRYAVGMEEISNVQKFLGDVNGDGIVDIEDAQLILKHSLEMQ